MGQGSEEEQGGGRELFSFYIFCLRPSRRTRPKPPRRVCACVNAAAAAAAAAAACVQKHS